jgi:hypothetical protein
MTSEQTPEARLPMPEGRALDLYVRPGLPVIRVWPTWDALPEMRAGLGEW